MTISFDITRTVTMEQKPSANVAVTSLNATSDEMAFAAALSKAVLDFAADYGNGKEADNAK